MENTESRNHPHLITRGNVDGLVSSSIFLRHCPESRVSYVASPAACARSLTDDSTPKLIYLVDIALTSDVISAIKKCPEGQRIINIDHHSPGYHFPISRDRSSAASLLHSHFGSTPSLDVIVAIADLLEGNDSKILDEQTTTMGRGRLEFEAKVLDFSWRLDINDDAFRREAAAALSHGSLPSQVPLIHGRYQEVISQGRWSKALERVRGRMIRIQDVGLVDLTNKKRSLYGFGSRACSEVAKEMRCHYAVLIQNQGETTSLSVRRLRPSGIDVGKFVEDFTRDHGIGGGGHAMSAGGRIVSEHASQFIDEFIATA